MTKPSIYVAPVHFDDFSGESFERLVFAYHLRVECWQQIEWYGQVGGDSGRDIWASVVNDFGQSDTMCIQCVNRDRLTKTKAISDFKKVLAGPFGKPVVMRFVCRSDVSATLRDTIKTFGEDNSIGRVDIWSGQEFEERLRSFAESLLMRFCKGVAFPDSPKDLGDFVRDLPPANDAEILARLSSIFERPAFTTPFDAESSLGDFKQALCDTIETINTGIRKTRDGTVFAKVHCRLDLNDATTKKQLGSIADSLNRLRMEFDKLERSGEIEQCESGGHLHLTHRAIQTMDEQRREILDSFRQIYPQLSATI